MKRIVVSPLSWGLGHATRDLPVIRDFLRRGHHVTIVACGRALALLRQEVPSCEFLELADYPPPYTASRHFVRKFVAMAPAMAAAIRREAARFQWLMRRRRVDLIFTDNRFNIRLPGVPSFILSHQLRFMVPPKVRPLEFTTESFNAWLLGRHRRVIVPDEADPDRNLSGRLSHELTRLPPDKVYYAGALASVRRQDVPQDIDVFVSVSGPEPQRAELERIVLEQVQDLEGDRIVVTLGQPEVPEVRQRGDRIAIFGFLDRTRQQEMMNRARLVVCRSGYTTVMELAELGRKALMIPTPGQTEQEYLAEVYARRGYFHTVSQYDLDLARDVRRARETSGIPFPVDTRANVERLYRHLFAPALEG